MTEPKTRKRLIKVGLYFLDSNERQFGLGQLQSFPGGSSAYFSLLRLGCCINNQVEMLFPLADTDDYKTKEPNQNQRVGQISNVLSILFKRYPNDCNKFAIKIHDHLISLFPQEKSIFF